MNVLDLMGARGRLYVPDKSQGHSGDATIYIEPAVGDRKKRLLAAKEISEAGAAVAEYATLPDWAVRG